MESYTIIPPNIQSGLVYHFDTDSGLLYEVRFGRKENDYFNVTVNFGVLNQEFEGEEYSVTNRGEIYRVMTTLMEILKLFESRHPHTRAYEFFAEFKDGEEEGPSKRAMLYYRYVKKILNENWNMEQAGNKFRIKKTDPEGKGLFDSKTN